MSFSLTVQAQTQRHYHGSITKLTTTKCGMVRLQKQLVHTMVFVNMVLALTTAQLG